MSVLDKLREGTGVTWKILEGLQNITLAIPLTRPISSYSIYLAYCQPRILIGSSKLCISDPAHVCLLNRCVLFQLYKITLVSGRNLGTWQSCANAF